MNSNITLNGFTQKYADICEKSDKIPAHYFDEYEVNRGLRDKTGKGVLVGLTGISRVEGSKMIDGIKTPCEGNLWYRGYDIKDLVKNLRGKRYGFEEIAYLLLFGELPSVKAQADFNEVLVAARSLSLTSPPFWDATRTVRRWISRRCSKALPSTRFWATPS